MENNIKCRYCKHTNYKKEGYRNTKLRGKIQKYYCFDCKRYFTNDAVPSQEKIEPILIQPYFIQPYLMQEEPAHKLDEESEPEIDSEALLAQVKTQYPGATIGEIYNENPRLCLQLWNMGLLRTFLRGKTNRK